jgi:3-hydroxyacyl-CoA dehydrogenase/enoyl-CoA hydratase/3-hydroxybutyryl-CoA epimerase
MQRISGTTDYNGFKNTDLVVEAIVEDLDIKKSVLKELEAHVSPETIIASNTSSLLINDMASALKNDKRFLGMHFFNPVHRMPLVEIVRGKNTSDEAVATLFALCKKTGKTPIVVNDGPGFLVNRLLVPYLVESISLLEEGHGLKTMDMAMRGFGMPMGPLELFDEIGLDVAWKVAKILKQSMADRMADSDLLEKMVNDKRLGKKNGLGFYTYKNGKKNYDQSVEKYIEIKNKSRLNNEELVQRMVYPMVNEAARCFEDKIVCSARDTDIGMIFGTGFAPFRGGLLNFADNTGLENIINTLNKFKNDFGGRFTPSNYLIKIQKDHGKFYH